MKGLAAASRDKQKAKKGIAFLGITNDTSSLILTKDRGVKEAGRDIALVAGTAGSEGLGYSRNTPGSSTCGAAPQVRTSWGDHDIGEPGSLLTQCTPTVPMQCYVLVCNLSI